MTTPEDTPRRRPPKGLRPAIGGMVIPAVWLCDCGQFNNVKDKTCIRCGAKQ